MKNLTSYCIVLLLLFAFNSSFATTYYSRATGNWNTNTTWSTTSGGTSVGAGVYPGANDVVIIERGFTVTVNGAFSCTTLNVGSTTGTNALGKLTFFGATSSLTVSGTVSIGGSSSTARTGNITFISGATLTAGDLVLGGAAATPAAGTIVMTANSTLSTGSLTVHTVAGNTWTPSTGTVILTDNNTLPTTIFTSFNNLVIDGGTTTINGGTYTAASLRVGSTANNTAANLTFSGTTPSLTVSGTVTVGGSGNTARTGNVTFSSGAALTAGDLVLGGTAATPAAGTIAMTAGGTLSTGSLTVNTVTGNTWTPGTGTVVMTDINTLPATIFTTFNNLTINGGTTTSSAAAITVNSTLTVSSGTLIFSATNADYTLSGDFIVSSGATFTHSVYWDATSHLISVAGNVAVDGLYNYTVRSHLQMIGTGKTIRSGTTAGSAFDIVTIMTGAVSASGQLKINDNFWATFNSTGSFSTNGNNVYAYATLLNAGGTVNVNGGSLTVTGGFVSGYSALSGVVNISSGTLTTDNLTLGIGGGINGVLNHSGGTANITNDLTIFSGSSYIASNSPAINIGGDWTNNGTFTPATSTVTFNGTTGQTISGTGTNTFYNLTDNDANDITLSGNITVNNTLNFTSGQIATGANAVIIPTSGSVTGASATSYVNGTLNKYILTGTTSKTFEIGDANYYTPVTLAFGGVNNSTGYISAKTTGTDHTNIATSGINSARDANRYWTLANNGVTFTAGKTYSPTFTFNTADLDAGAATASFIVKRYAAGWNATTTGTLTATTSQATGLSATQFGDFAAGNTTGTGTTSSVVSSLNPACQASSVTFTGTVLSGGAAVQEGTITFYDGATAIATNVALNASGQATYTTTSLATGSRSIKIVFNGTTNFTTSTSTILTQTVTAAPTAVAGTAVSTCAASGAVNITAGSSASNQSSVTWSSSGTGTFTNANSLTTATYTPSAADTTAGSVVLTLTANPNGTCTLATSTKTLTIHSTPIATISPNYCIGGGVVRLAANASSSYLWSSGETTQSIDVDIAGSKTVTIKDANGCTGSTTYTVSTELVTNGNFSAGNTGFTTLYTYTTAANGLQPEGLYAVDTNANYFHTNFYGKDHTTGSGKFMIVNGGPSLQTIWQQNITIVPNTTYYFSAWAMSLNNVSPYAQLQFAINGTQVGSAANLPAGPSSTAGPFTWTRFYGTWNSGALTSATISIIDLQTAAGGNDLGIDDISFSTLSPATMTVAPLGNGGVPVCTQSTLNFAPNVTGGNYPVTYAWSGVNSFTSTVATPSIASVAAVNAGAYNLTVTDAFGCTASGSTTVKVNALPVMTSANTATICSGATVNIPLTSDSTATYAWVASDNSNTTGESLTLQTTNTLSNTITSTSSVQQNVAYIVIPTSTFSGCAGAAQSVTVKVNPAATISLTSALATTNQSVCISSNITSITYGTTNATGVTYSGLPTGVSGIYNAGTGVVTISGTPSVAGTYNYTVTPIGCGAASATGTIIVTPNETITLTSLAATTTQTVCINTGITAITYSTANATGATFIGLPTGVTGTYNAGTGAISISGTPSVSGTFNYTATPTGCGTAKATGTITITPAETITLTSTAATTTQTVCISTGITAITYSTANATGATFAGLPTGVTGSYNAGTGAISISGTPSVSGTFNYTVTPTGCGAASATGTITVTPNETIILTSLAATTTQTVCISTGITAITYSTANATGATFAGLPTGVTGSYNAATGAVSISGTPSVSGTFNYTVTPTGCGTAKATGTITVTPAETITLTSTAATTAQTVCISTGITAITYNTANATGATFSGLPTGVTGSYNAGTGAISISGTPSVSGTFNYTVTPTGCGTAKATGTITVTPAETITLTSLVATTTQTVCISTGITAITYNTSNATGATFSGLPTGVTGTYNAGTGAISISGTPSVSGTFNYTVTPTGCGTAKATGTITVTPAETITLTSTAATTTQTVCISTGITAITYNTANATGATFAGLPTGVTGSYNAGTGAISISGTPSVSGTFNYTVTPTGCGAASATGTITVTPNETITLTSTAATTTQTVCISTGITAIIYSTANATGATFAGLPTGVTGTYNAGTGAISISGTPSVSGTFNYTVTPTGCGAASATGTITVTPNETITLTSLAATTTQTVCISTGITAITYNTANATGATFSGLPTGVTGSYNAGTGAISISGTPSVSGTFNYTVTPTGCGAATATGTITVTPAETITLTSLAATTTQTVCISTGITAITYSTANATGATFAGLPTGVTGTYNAGTGAISISGTPSVSGTFNYTVTPTGCGAAKATGTITVTPAETITLTSLVATTTQTVCISTGITAITYSTANATGATFAGLPTGVTGTYNAGTGAVSISGTPSVSGTFNYTVTPTGCGTAKATGTITVTPAETITLTSTAATTAQTVCISTSITAITYSSTNATGATFAGLPTGVTGSYNAGTGAISISGTPSVSGTFNYTVTPTGCGAASATGTITVTPNETIILTSLAATTTQTVCISTGITAITYSTANATGATFAGLPTGVTGTYNAGTGAISISGTPSVSGTFNYTVTPTGCGTAKATGTITVTPAETITLTSLVATTTQTVCISTGITAITYSTANATGATFAGLPTGVTGSYNAGTGAVSISGTPSVSGTFNYTVTPTGCGTAKATGTITVTPAETITLTSLVATTTQTVCISTGITAITYSTANATGATFAGLPTGVTGSYNAGTGAISISGTPSVSGTFNYTVTPTGCGTAKATGTIVVKATSTLSTVTVPSTCSGNAATVNLTGLVANSANTINYSINGIAQTPVSGVNADASGNASFTTSVVTTTNNGQPLLVTAINNGGCSLSFSKSATLSVTSSGTWLGVNTNWNDASNWCGGVPTKTTDVLITSGMTYYPNLTSGITGKTHNITIQTGASVTLNNATMQVAGTISNSGTFDAVLGSVELNGSSAQTIAGSTFKTKTILNLIVSNTSGASLSTTSGDTLNISGTFSFGNVNNTNFNTNDNLTLLSNALTTARVADITNGGVNSGNTITGKAVVQRFMPQHRAWRLMTAPVKTTSAPSISAAWQEGAVDVTLGQRVNPYPGYGTHITGGPTRNASGVGNTNNDGYDAGPNNTSIYYFTGSAWAIPTNTNSTPITNYSGYMLFVRGNRNTNLAMATTAPLSTTILRPKGLLNTGTQTYNLSGATSFHVIGNPYASAINYSSVSTHNVNASSYYYSMDPLMTGTFGVGSFVTYIPSGSGGYVAIPDPTVSSIANVITHPVDLNGNIQSGSAFIVYNSSSTSSITINEQDKVSGSNTYLFRPATTPSQQLRANLYAKDADGNSNLLDGVMNLFNTDFSDSVDLAEDVKKMGNIAENLCLYRRGQNLTAEKRQPLVATDTVFYNLLSIQHTSYSLEFISSNLTPGLTGMIKDSYTGTSTPLTMEGNTVVNFTVDNNAASKAANRFMIVFRPAVTLPVTFTNIKAAKQNKDVAVQWQVANEVDVKQYQVERSTDGTNFTTVATVTATANNKPSATYNWIDENPISGTNYYRVISIDNNGTVAYTPIVSVNIGSSNSSITVYPNPVTNGIIHVQMNNMAGGVYHARLLNAIGQVMLDKEINHTAGISSETIQYDTKLSTGAYQLEIFNADNNKTNTTLLIQ